MVPIDFNMFTMYVHILESNIITILENLSFPVNCFSQFCMEVLGERVAVVKIHYLGRKVIGQ